MAQSEKVLWEILSLMHENTAGWTITVADKPKHHEVENSYAVSHLKSQLLLKFLPSDIEDTIYFMKHREYIIIHGQGLIIPEIAYSMTEKAISVFNNKELPEEEKEAFKESLWNIEPKVYGMGPNLSAWKKLIINVKKKLHFKK